VQRFFPRGYAVLKGEKMGLFGKIMAKLGFPGSEPEAVLGPKAEAALKAGFKAPSMEPGAPPPPAPITLVDVMSKLEGLAKDNPQKLNWKTSIVDLLKLLDLDSSFAARKELATELGCPSEKMKDSAQMNMWLHKAVLQKLADNGGNVPKELLD